MGRNKRFDSGLTGITVRQGLVPDNVRNFAWVTNKAYPGYEFCPEGFIRGTESKAIVPETEVGIYRIKIRRFPATKVNETELEYVKRLEEWRKKGIAILTVDDVERIALHPNSIPAKKKVVYKEPPKPEKVNKLLNKPAIGHSRADSK